MDCAVSTCTKPSVAKGFCKAHWHKNHRYGDPLGGASYSRGQGLEFLNTLLGHADEGACVTWPYGCTRDGYGVLVVDGQQHKASRVMCEIEHGPPPTGDHHAAHSCGKGHEGCVNPRHVRWATASENQQDRVLHGTDLRGEKNPRSLLTERDARRIRFRAQQGESAVQIAKDYPATTDAIRAVIKRRTWAWL